jgi:hypothetical protein
MHAADPSIEAAHRDFVLAAGKDGTSCIGQRCGTAKPDLVVGLSWRDVTQGCGSTREIIGERRSDKSLM